MKEKRATQETREMLQLDEESNTIVPQRSKWQVLLMEYELLDAFWTHIHGRIWSSGLVLVGLSMLGVAFLAVAMDPRSEFTAGVVGLVSTVAILLSLGWWLLLRRLHSMQRVAEYRKREIERDLGMRHELYLSFLRERRAPGRRPGPVVQRLAEGDDALGQDLRGFAQSNEANPWLPRLMGEQLVWNSVPWLLIIAWAALLILKLPVN
jgi:hypothetical protein